MKNLLVVAGAASLISAGTLSANLIDVDSINGGLLLNPGDLSGVVFNNPSTTFTVDELFDVNQNILADGEAGLTLDGKITIFSAFTTEGLSIFTLIDEQFVPSRGGSSNASVEMASSTNSSSARFVRDPEGSLTHIEASEIQQVLGFMSWDSSDQGSGFAWTGLVAGNNGTFDFIAHEEGGTSEPGPQDYWPTFPGLVDSDTFQFLNWNEDDGEWEVVSVESFSQTHEFALAFSVLPVPSAAGLGVAGLLGLAGLGRRRRA